jgi:hypothetical protein
VKTRITYLIIIVIPGVGFPLLAGEIFFRRPKTRPITPKHRFNSIA